MCFSDAKQISKQRQATLRQLGEERKKYMKDKQLSTYLTCMIEYMQKALQCTGYSVKQGKNVLSCIPCCGPPKFRNVRKQFQKAFESCSNEEQFEYYRKFVNYMTQKQIPPPLASVKPAVLKAGSSIIVVDSNDEYTFSVTTQGSFLWNSESAMTIIPDRLCLNIKSLTEAKQLNLNLRNYILRKSRSSKSNTFVLCGIVPVNPPIVRFSIPKQNKNAPLIINMISQLADRALQQNVLNWRQPIDHITRAKTISDFKQPKVKVPQDEAGKKEEQYVPKVKIGMKDINNPLKNMVLDKAKIQLQKKVRQYNETLVDPTSKRSNISSLIRQSDRGSNTLNNKNQTLRKNNINLIKDQYEIPQQKEDRSSLQTRNQKQNQVKDSNNNNTLIQNLLNINNEAFKKKPKIAMSENNEGPLGLAHNLKKKPSQRKNEIKNHALQPSHTRSQAGSNKYLKQDALSRIQNKNSQQEEQVVDSGKSLLYELDQGIDEEQQFGNASQLSKESVQNSFQTIPDVMR